MASGVTGTRRTEAAPPAAAFCAASAAFRPGMASVADVAAPAAATLCCALTASAAVSATSSVTPPISLHILRLSWIVCPASSAASLAADAALDAVRLFLTPRTTAGIPSSTPAATVSNNTLVPKSLAISPADFLSAMPRAVSLIRSSAMFSTADPAIFPTTCAALPPLRSFVVPEATLLPIPKGASIAPSKADSPISPASVPVISANFCAPVSAG